MDVEKLLKEEDCRNRGDSWRPNLIGRPGIRQQILAIRNFNGCLRGPLSLEPVFAGK